MMLRKVLFCVVTITAAIAFCGAAQSDVPVQNNQQINNAASDERPSDISGDSASSDSTTFSEKSTHAATAEFLKHLSSEQMDVLVDAFLEFGPDIWLGLIYGISQLPPEECADEIARIKNVVVHIQARREQRQQFLNEFYESTRLGMSSKIFVALLGVARAYARVREREAQSFERTYPHKDHISHDSNKTVGGRSLLWLMKASGPALMFKGEMIKFLEIMRFYFEKLRASDDDGVSGSGVTVPRLHPEEEALLESYAIMMSQIVTNGTRAINMFREDSMFEYEQLLRGVMGGKLSTCASVGLYNLLPAFLNYHGKKLGENAPSVFKTRVSFYKSEDKQKQNVQAAYPDDLQSYDPNSLKSDPSWKREVLNGSNILVSELALVPLWSYMQKRLGQDAMDQIKGATLGVFNFRLIGLASGVITTGILYNKQFKIGQLIADFGETTNKDGSKRRVFSTKGGTDTYGAYVYERTMRHVVLSISSFTLEKMLQRMKLPICGPVETIADNFVQLLPKPAAAFCHDFVQMLRMAAKLYLTMKISLQEQAMYAQFGYDMETVQRYITSLPPSYFDGKAHEEAAASFAKYVYKEYKHLNYTSSRKLNKWDAFWMGLDAILWYLRVSGEPLQHNPFAVVYGANNEPQLAGFGQISALTGLGK